MQQEQSKFNWYRALMYVRILHNILVNMLNELFTAVPMNFILSIGPSLHFNPNLIHINTAWEQVQVQIQAVGLSNKHASLLIFGIESNKQLPEFFHHLINLFSQLYLSLMVTDREISQKTLLGGPKYHRRDLLACWSSQAAFGCLDSNLVWWHHGQLTEKGRSQWINAMASPFCIRAGYTNLLISHMKQLKPARTVRVK